MARKKQDFFRVAPCARNDFPKALDTCEKMVAARDSLGVPA
jgi:hypothetical protein